jgi:hypothetical protein
MTLLEGTEGLLETLSRYRRAGMLLLGQPKGLEPGLADGKYMYFGHVFDRLLESRGLNQSTFAAECRKRGFKIRAMSGRLRDVQQRSVSDWMRGITACPREIPVYADAIMEFDDEEWEWFGAAYAYGQTVPKEDFEDLMEFRKFYRAGLTRGGSDEAEKAKKG